ncbi:hypothetical protein DFS34DRAFT_687781 [Phlyctochytrium arcticum]|nr:hypothetical protein DFS34DRAFT_687781 [Phlyctochytrium arcticum]
MISSLIWVFEEAIPLAVDAPYLLASGDIDSIKNCLQRLYHLFVRLEKKHYVNIVLFMSGFLEKLLPKMSPEKAAAIFSVCSSEVMEVFQSVLHPAIRFQDSDEQVSRKALLITAMKDDSATHPTCRHDRTPGSPPSLNSHSMLSVRMENPPLSPSPSPSNSLPTPLASPAKGAKGLSVSKKPQPVVLAIVCETLIPLQLCRQTFAKPGNEIDISQYQVLPPPKRSAPLADITNGQGKPAKAKKVRDFLTEETTRGLQLTSCGCGENACKYQAMYSWIAHQSMTFFWLNIDQVSARETEGMFGESHSITNDRMICMMERKVAEGLDFLQAFLYLTQDQCRC